MKHSEWGHEFPRLYELAEAAAEQGKGRFFAGFAQTLQIPLAREYYHAWEHHLGRLDRQAWDGFMRELLDTFSATSDDPASRAQVFARLSEAIGYVCLLDLGYREVSFIPRAASAGRRTPDLKAIDAGQIVALMEVKTIRQSDREANWVNDNTRRLHAGQPPSVRRLSPCFPDGLKRKLRAHLKKAINQLSDYPAPGSCRRIVLFLIKLDPEPAAMRGIDEAIQDFLEENTGDSQIEIRCEFL